MRSGEDLRGMTPVEIAAILNEVSTNKPGISPAQAELVKLAKANGTVSVSPIIPNRPERYEFHVASADARQISLRRSQNGQEVIIPAACVAEVLLHAGTQPAELTVSGRLQWLSLKEQWRVFDEMPGSAVGLQ